MITFIFIQHHIQSFGSKSYRFGKWQDKLRKYNWLKVEIEFLKTEDKTLTFWKLKIKLEIQFSENIRYNFRKILLKLKVKLALCRNGNGTLYLIANKINLKLTICSFVILSFLTIDNIETNGNRQQYKWHNLSYLIISSRRHPNIQNYIYKK